jgi:hypothetical protein
MLTVVAVASTSVVVELLMVRSVVVVRGTPIPNRDRDVKSKEEPPRSPLPHELFAKELALRHVLATRGITPEYAVDDTNAADGDDANNKAVTATWRRR